MIDKLVIYMREIIRRPRGTTPACWLGSRKEYEHPDGIHWREKIAPPVQPCPMCDIAAQNIGARVNLELGWVIAEKHIDDDLHGLAFDKGGKLLWYRENAATEAMMGYVQSQLILGLDRVVRNRKAASGHRKASPEAIAAFRDKWIAKNHMRRGWKKAAMAEFGIKDPRTLDRFLSKKIV